MTIINLPSNLYRFKISKIDKSDDCLLFEVDLTTLEDYKLVSTGKIVKVKYHNRYKLEKIYSKYDGESFYQIDWDTEKKLDDKTA